MVVSSQLERVVLPVLPARQQPRHPSNEPSATPAQPIMHSRPTPYATLASTSPAASSASSSAGGGPSARLTAVAVSLAMGLLLPGTAASPATGVRNPAAETARPETVVWTADDIRAVAKEAYVWGWPLAYVHHCRRQLDKVPSHGQSGGMPVAPVNRLSMLVDRISPRAAAPCPNQDVIYGFGMFDLAESPVVLQVPDFGHRFWLYQLGDQRTDGFAELGAMYGTRPGFHLVVGPGWAGRVPAGIEAVHRSPTRHAFCIPRVFFSASGGDRDAAIPAINRIMAYPLDEFSGEMRSRDWSKLRWFPRLSAAGRRDRAVAPDTFFETLPDVLDDVPPLPGEERLYARFRRLVRAIEDEPDLAAVAVEAAAEAERDVVAPLFEFRNVGRPLPGHWTTLVNGAAFGTDYLTRTAVAKSNVFVNRHRETKYYYQDLDAAGTRLDGSREYRITFPAGSLPPARGFWSLTVYDAAHTLPQGCAGRHAVGSRDTDLVFAADGSFTVVVGPAPDDDAGWAEESTGRRENRLVAPPGPFSLYLRLYWPAADALDGSWVPPAVHPAGTRVAAILPKKRDAG